MFSKVVVFSRKLHTLKVFSVLKAVHPKVELSTSTSPPKLFTLGYRV